MIRGLSIRQGICTWSMCMKGVEGGASTLPSLVLPPQSRRVSEREGWLLAVAALFLDNTQVSKRNLAVLYWEKNRTRPPNTGHNSSCAVCYPPVAASPLRPAQGTFRCERGYVKLWSRNCTLATLHYPSTTSMYAVRSSVSLISRNQNHPVITFLSKSVAATDRGSEGLRPCLLPCTH